jgi:hypothetical protein
MLGSDLAKSAFLSPMRQQVLSYMKRLSISKFSGNEGYFTVRSLLVMFKIRVVNFIARFFPK